MDLWKYICLWISSLTIISGFSVLHNNKNEGRKLFGGYQIVPKICKPTYPSRLKSNEPPICMFNYECTRRHGEVVGACMDGFLFGACCQLPSSSLSSSLPSSYHSEGIPPLIVNEKLDHVPDIPILLKPNRTPIDDTAIDQPDTVSKPSTSSYSTSSQLDELEQNFPAFLGSQNIIDSLSMQALLSHSDSKNDIQEQKETVSAINPIMTLLTPDQVLQITDPVDRLPILFSQSISPSNYSIAETILINKNGTLFDDINNPDVLFKPTNRSTTLSDYFTTIGTATTKMLPVNYINTEKLMDSTTQLSSTAELIRVPTITNETPSGNKKHDDEYDREEIAINHIISMLNDTAPDASSRTPTRITTIRTPNKPSPIHTWVTLDETSIPSTNSHTVSYGYYKPSTKPPNFYYYESEFSSTSESEQPKSTTPPSYSNYYTTTNQKYPSTYSSSLSTNKYSNTPTTLQPAPTVIVLGPWETSGTTEETTTAKPIQVTRQPILSSNRPTLLTKKPNVGATITHNISTIITTDDSATASATSNIISTSYVNFKLKEPNTPNSITTQPEIITKKPTVWTTLAAWSSKPSFQLKPGKPEYNWSQETFTPVHTLIFKTTLKPLTTSDIGDSEGATAASDELSNFPPDRNPDLINSTLTSQQDNLTITVTSNNTGYPLIDFITENEILTPEFNKNDAFNNKVDDFVNKIVDSFEGNFQDLKDVIYSQKNISTTTPAYYTIVTQKPSSKKPTGKPTGSRKPTTKRPNPSARPGTVGGLTTKPVKLSTKLPKPTSTSRPLNNFSVTTKRTIISTTSKRSKPTKKITTTTQSSTAPVSTTVEVVTHGTAIVSSEIEETVTQEPDFRSECGIRPLMKKGRVVGGKSAEFGEWPWQVLVREATWLGLFTKNKCGGVIITNKYVATAAHCQPGFLASLRAVFGEYDISGNMEPRPSFTRNVKRVIVHRAYNPATFENDLALLELETPIVFDSHILPICMPNDNEDFTGRMATVTGWGRVKYNGGVPSTLQEVQVPVMENSVCQDMFRTAGHSKLILDSFLCAGYANGQKDSCEGDSGGPLMMERPDGKWELVGTVSHGIKCADPYLPGVYMRTTHFKPWLHSVTGV